VKFKDKDTFLNAPTEDIAAFVRSHQKPQLGVFVPDGSRRLVSVFTNVQPDTEEFYRLCASLPAQYLLRSLKVFFEHGLPMLLVPILSRSVLNRGSNYRQLTALEGLKLLFAGEEWFDFYKTYDVRVRIYGEPERLAGTECEVALDWIEKTCEQTAAHQTHTLLFAIGESPILGQDIATMGINFYRQHQREPTFEEQVRLYYGDDLPPADFYIMTSKVSGLGALPRFLVNSDTEAYFLPVAGAMGLNLQTYRLILYDLLFERAESQGKFGEDELSAKAQATLKAYYQRVAHRVIGLGQRIGPVWVPEE
jgi:hypothetical protein